MEPNALKQVLWALYVLATASVLIALVRERLVSSWPSLTALCSFQLLTSATLFAVHHNYKSYFYVYWVSVPIQSALRLWLLADGLKSIPGTDFIKERFHAAVISGSSLIALGSLFCQRSGHIAWVFRLPSSQRELFQSILLFDRSTANFCVMCCALALLAVFLLGLGWERVGASIVCGLAVQFIALAMCSALLTRDTHSLDFIAYLDELCRIGVLCFWSGRIHKPIFLFLWKAELLTHE